MRQWQKKFLIVAGLLFLSLPKLGLACSVCFGDPNSSESRGLVLAVYLLLGVVMTTLGGITAVALSWIARAKKANLNF